ncbi:MAG: Gfo/Idh/MocA family oxidoreductase [Phycisphaerae bacterium]
MTLLTRTETRATPGAVRQVAAATRRRRVGATPRPLRAAVVGTGYWGPNLARNFSTIEGVELRSVCDPQPEALRRMERQYPRARQYSALAELLTDRELDLVAVATPVRTHFELARAALSAGKHVLVEKPLAASVAECEELINVARRAGRVLMVDHTFVYHPAVEKVADLGRRGELGDLCYYDSVRINLGLFQRDANVLWDLAPHDVSIMEHLIARPPRWVQAAGARHAGQLHETMAYVTVQYADNILGHVHVNWLSPVKVRQVCIGGSKRMLIYDDNQVTEKVRVYDRGVELTSAEGIHQALVQYRAGDMVAPAIPNDEALRRVVQHFLFCVRQERPPLTDGAAGLRVVRVLEAAQRSLDEDGARVPL